MRRNSNQEDCADLLDAIVLDGFRWNSTAFDPDGVGAILPAITSVLFGALAGQILLIKPSPQMLRVMVAASSALGVLAASNARDAEVSS